MNNPPGQVTLSSGGSADPAQLQDLSILLLNVTASAIPLIGLISFVMLLVGGFTVLTSAGNDEGLKRGKGIITGSIVGLVAAILSWLILLLIETITGVPVTDFKLGL